MENAQDAQIREGLIFTPKDEGNFYFNNQMKIIKVTSQDADGFIFWESQNPKKDNRIPNNKRWNKGSCRVWFFKEFCRVLEMNAQDLINSSKGLTDSDINEIQLRTERSLKECVGK